VHAHGKEDGCAGGVPTGANLPMASVEDDLPARFQGPFAPPGELVVEELGGAAHLGTGDREASQFLADPLDATSR
jgi:hypothetical protein